MYFDSSLCGSFGNWVPVSYTGMWSAAMLSVYVMRQVKRERCLQKLTWHFVSSERGNEKKSTSGASVPSTLGLRLGDYHSLELVYIGFLNTLRPRQNGSHFADDIFNGIFLNENVWIPIKFSLKFVPKGPINNIPALVQIMAWRRPGDKPLSEAMVVRSQTHICVTQPQWVNLFWKCKHKLFYIQQGKINTPHVI